MWARRLNLLHGYIGSAKEWLRGRHRGIDRAGRRVAAIVVISLMFSLSLALPPTVSAAAAIPAAPGTPITSFPFYASAGLTGGPGGPGSAAANTAVSANCNRGQALYNPQWFALPAGSLGSVYGNGDAFFVIPGGASSVPFGTAFVDSVNGTVVSCDIRDLASSTVARPLSAVIYFAGYPADCTLDPDYCPELGSDLYLFINTTTGVPPSNDKVANARVITSLPFTETVDNAFADADGPVPEPELCPMQVDKYFLHTVWWKYTPTVTGPAPKLVLTSDIAFGLDTNFLISTATGPALLPRADEWDCNPPAILQAGVTYYFTVYHRGDNYYNAYGAPLATGGKFTLKVTPTPPVVPDAPNGVAATKNDSAHTATLSWAEPTSPGGSSITGYRVSRDGTDSGGGGPWSTVLPASARSKTFSLLNAWDTYTLKVEAINAVGIGPAGSAAVMLTAATPSAPLSVKATAGATGTQQATVTWSTPAQQGGSPVVSYRVRRFAGSTATVQTTTTVPATARTFTATGLVAGSAYSFDVVAVNSAGAGRTPSRSGLVTPLSLPAPATGLVTSASAAGRSATVSWKAPSVTGGTPITGYRVSRDGNDSGTTGPFSVVVPATTLTKTFTYLLPWDTYTLKVEAITSAGTGPAASATVLVPGTAPSAPQTVVAKAGSKQITLSWSAPAQIGTSVITGYVIRRYAGDTNSLQATVTVAASARSSVAAGLTSGAGYSFTITATNAAGPGRTSARSAVTTPQ